MRSYLVIIEHPQEDGDSYGAYSPDLPGCIATGQSEEEVIARMSEAIQFHLDGMLQNGEELPRRTVDAVEIPVWDRHDLRTWKEQGVLITASVEDHAKVEEITGYIR